jgi:CRP-like cAMP-binding protein
MLQPGNAIAASADHPLGELFANAAVVRVKAGKILFNGGDPASGCYLVEEGCLKVAVGLLPRGERIVSVLAPGSIIGELSMIDGSPRSATVTAVKDSRLRFVSQMVFQSFAESHPEIFRHLTTFLARRLRATNTVVAAGALPLKGRVARALLDLADAFGRDVGSGRILIHQKITQGDLAAMAGIARESVSRILNDWKKSSLVSRVSGYYCLESRAAILDEAQP